MQSATRPRCRPAVGPAGPRPRAQRGAIRTTALFGKPQPGKPQASKPQGGKPQGSKAGGPKKQLPSGGPRGQGGSLLDSDDIPVYAEPFSIDKCLNLYHSFFKWLGRPLGF
ncbi:hypothetical protein TSOC_005819 [Tetrabaena socialis]|uniref:Uncharacterized protein n=1 Tax=Tetrabaena socialis TaxID=47790 RepID=A0A2J8A590_9CHLO|nr:hypothetical protein TSOC_005819 [Tetrabaena socialis]|eukprot:PNH07681.1 hypothetical protein TSOC_005819 [Tetrabaena socialis]